MRRFLDARAERAAGRARAQRPLRAGTACLIEAAEKSVGAHHSEPYRLRIKYLCEDLDVLRRRLKDLARDVERKLDDHEVGKLLMTIEGLSPLTTARLIAELGDPARFDSPGAIASYVGVIGASASMRKLLTAVWSVATHRRPFRR